MTLLKPNFITKFANEQRQKLFEKGMALIALANLGLVIFDLSYVPFRDFWLQGTVQLYLKIAQLELYIPPKPLRIFPINVTPAYDWVKDIEPNRDTATYLETVDNLIYQLKTKPVTDLEVQNTLKKLGELSTQMIETDPFQRANKTGSLEKLKNKMRWHIYKDYKESAKQSFNQFWSPENLQEPRINQEIAFFQQEIRPLMERNYFRHIGENGAPVDNFGLLDFPVGCLFFFEYLARTWYISRSHVGVSWREALLWRWYDIFLFTPIFRWLRIIPVVIRLHQSGLIDLKDIQKQASQGFVASIAEDLTQVVVLQVINQIQGVVKQGQISQLLANTTGKQYVDINDTNESIELVKIILKLLVERILPRIQNDVEGLLNYSISKGLKQAGVLSNLQQLPGFEDLQKTIIQQVITQLYQIISEVLKVVLEEDKEFEQRLETLAKNVSNSLTSEMKAKESITEIESLIVDLLEEVKINYVGNLSEQDIEDILEQTRRLRQNIPQPVPIIPAN